MTTLPSLPADYRPQSIVILCDGQKAVHVEGDDMQLDVEWTAEREPERLEVFWDGVLVYAQVHQQITVNRLEQVTGHLHPMDWMFQSLAGQSEGQANETRPAHHG